MSATKGSRESSPFGELEKRIGYRFENPGLLQRALTHSSWGVENNERLEFLGDAVLNLAVASELYRESEGEPESTMSEERAGMVNNVNLSDAARGLGLSGHLRLGTGERRTGGETKHSVLSSAVEAVIAAVYLDGGFENARIVTWKILSMSSKSGSDGQGVVKPTTKHPKSLLQELLAKHGDARPTYTASQREGPPHMPRWEVVCSIKSLGKSASGAGSSKREAETNAAIALLEAIEE